MINSKALQLYKVEAFNVELTKNLNKVVRSTNRITKNSKKDSKVVQPIQMKNCPPNSFKYIDNNIFSIKQNISLLFTIIYQLKGFVTNINKIPLKKQQQIHIFRIRLVDFRIMTCLFCLHLQKIRKNGK